MGKGKDLDSVKAIPEELVKGERVGAESQQEQDAVKTHQNQF